MYKNVGIIAIKISSKTPIYFPRTMFWNEIGLVTNNSKVPIFFSSLKDFIVTAGTRNKSTHGANKKNASREAKPASKMLKSPLKTQRKRPFITKKTPMTK